MTPLPSSVSWSQLPEYSRAKLNAFSSLYSIDSQALWKTIGGELRYLKSDSLSETIPVFVKGVGPFAHAQLFVQGLPVVLPDNQTQQNLLIQSLKNEFTRVTLVDFANQIASDLVGWYQRCISTEMLTISPDFEPPDPDLRSELRKSQREGLIVGLITSESDCSDVLALFAQHGKQNTRRFPSAFLAELARLAQSHTDIIWLIARQNDQAVGSQVFVRIGDELLYWLSVLDRTAVAAKPAVALLNEGIRRGAQLGAVRCNLGSSPSNEEGLLAFKRRWGSASHEYSVYSHGPWWWPK